jgi:hypothetical protein
MPAGDMPCDQYSEFHISCKFWSFSASAWKSGDEYCRWSSLVLRHTWAHKFCHSVIYQYAYGKFHVQLLD